MWQQYSIHEQMIEMYIIDYDASIAAAADDYFIGTGWLGEIIRPFLLT